MSDHLPECEWNDETRVNRHCICPSLRACEQRVSSEFLTPMALASTGMSDPRYAKGYADGLDAAREAVERVSSLLQPLGPALAAIDALREKP